MAIVSVEETMRVLSDFNPWWAGAARKIPRVRRLAFRECLHYLTHPILTRAVLLTGPRRVGKSTVVHQLIQQLLDEGVPPESILFASMDHPVLKLHRIPAILDIYHGAIAPREQAGKIYLFLDEIQYAKDWDLELKQLCDHSENYRIIATGSAALAQQSRVAESGVGRWTRVYMPTLSFYEFLLLREQAIDGLQHLSLTALFKLSQRELIAVSERLSRTLPLFRRYIMVGGFPETARLDDLYECQRLLREDVVERVLRRDFTLLYGVRRVDELERLFLYLCVNTGGIFSANKASKELQCSLPLVNQYMAHLDDAHLIYRLKPFGINALKAQSKVYLADAAMRNAVLAKPINALEDAAEIGQVVESTVFRHLYAANFRVPVSYTYWRDPRRGLEVDFVLKMPSTAVPMEVKYRQDAHLKDCPGLAAFIEKHDTPRGYIVTRSEMDFGIETAAKGVPVLRIPAHVLCYFVGQQEMADLIETQ